MASDLFRDHSLKNKAGPATVKIFSRRVPEISVVFSACVFAIYKQASFFLGGVYKQASWDVRRIVISICFEVSNRHEHLLNINNVYCVSCLEYLKY